MKRIMFFMVLLLGTIATFAQKEKPDVVDLLLHELASTALKDGIFIIRIYSYSLNADYDDRYCFLEMTGNEVLYQMYDGRADEEPWTGVTHAPIMYQGTATDFSIKHAPNGEIHFTALLQIPYESRNLWWNIVLKKDSNECTVSKSKIKGEFKGFFKGKLYPKGTTSVMKGVIRR